MLFSEANRRRAHKPEGSFQPNLLRPADKCAGGSELLPDLYPRNWLLKSWHNTLPIIALIMNDLPARIDPEEAAIDRPTQTARRLVEASVSPNTRRAYAGATPGSRGASSMTRVSARLPRRAARRRTRLVERLDGGRQPGRVDDGRDVGRELENQPDGSALTPAGATAERGAVARYL